MKAKKVISKVLAAALASAMLLSCVYAASPDRTMSSAAQSNGNFSASATTNGRRYELSAVPGSVRLSGCSG